MWTENFIQQIADGKEILPPRVPITKQEDFWFQKAVEHKIVEFKKGGEFAVNVKSRGPYHLFERSGRINREWIIQIASLSRLVLYSKYPRDNLQFEYNHKNGKNYYPLDIVVFTSDHKVFLYVETKIQENQIKHILIELEKYKKECPRADIPDRGNDPLRKAKYICGTDIDYVWFSSPESFDKEKYIYRINKNATGGFTLILVEKLPKLSRL